MNKVLAIFNLFRQGGEVLDPAKWKNRQVNVNLVYLFIIAAAAVSAAFGYPIPIDNETWMAVSAAVFTLVNSVLTLVTSRKVGLPPKNTDGSGGVHPATLSAGDPRGGFSDGS